MAGVELRETASVLINAPRDRVLEVLRHRMEEEPGLQVGEDRLVSRRGTFVLRQMPEGGTRLIHARSQPARIGIFPRPKEELRHAVQAELFEVQQLLGMRSDR